jgi:hypothetical protein
MEQNMSLMTNTIVAKLAAKLLMEAKATLLRFALRSAILMEIKEATFYLRSHLTARTKIKVRPHG